MKRLIAIMLIVALAITLTACAKEAPAVPSSIITISLDGTEYGAAYYTAYISSTFDWNSASFEKQCEIIDWTLQKCKEEAKADSATSFSVIAQQDSGHKAFSWNGGNSVDIQTYSKALGFQNFSYALSELP